MVPAALVDGELDALRAAARAGDIVIDGGNSHYHDDIRRAAALRGHGPALRRRRHQRRRVGARARLLPDDRRRGGGRAAARSDLRDAGARASARSRARRARNGRDGTAEQGYLHCGPSGAGHFVKMVHNGIEYGLMAAYAEGFNILRHAGAGWRPAPPTPRRRRCAIPSTTSTTSTSAEIAEVWRRGSVIASWLLDLTAEALPRARSRRLRRPGLGLGRGALDHRGGDRRGVPAPVLSAALYERFSSRGEATSRDRLLSALRYQFGGHRRERHAGASADDRRRSRRAGLLRRHRRPGLQADLPGAARDGPARHLDVPVIGVARAGWTLEQLRARARDSIERARRRSIRRRSRRCRRCCATSSGDYEDPATYAGAARGARRRAAPAALPGDPAQPVRGRRRPGRSGCAERRARRRREAVRPRPRLGRGAQRARCTSTSPRRRSSASTTTWARSRSRTSSTSASPTRSSSRSGTATTSTACRSRWPRASASRAAASSTRRPARSATWCRTTCCRSSACWRWSRRAATAPRRCATRRRRCFRPMRPLAPADVVRGQFRGYRERGGRRADSQVETFAAVRLHIDTWRWAGVPFYIRAGKRLPVTATEVLVELKQPPAAVFADCVAARANHFRFRLSPEVVLALGARAKTPGRADGAARTSSSVACHDARRRDGRLRAPARRRDARRPDAVRARGQRAEAAWRVVDPVLGPATPLYEYDPAPGDRPRPIACSATAQGLAQPGPGVGLWMTARASPARSGAGDGRCRGSGRRGRGARGECASAAIAAHGRCVSRYRGARHRASSISASRPSRGGGGSVAALPRDLGRRARGPARPSATATTG